MRYHHDLPKRRGLRALITAVALTAFAAAAAAQQTTLEQAREQGFIRVGFADEAPYGYVDQDGRLTGESPEVARAIFEQLGIEHMDGVLTEFGALIPGLNAGRWDVVAAGMFITPERCKRADFSIPTYKMGQAFLVPEGNPLDLHSYEDVADNPEVTLAVMAGAVELGYARKAGVSEEQIKQFPDQASLLAGVRSGRVDAAALTSPSIERMAQRTEGTERTQPFHTPPYAVGYGGLAFRPGDDALREAVNEKLKAFIGSEEHLKLVKPFGFTEANVPEDGVTVEEICQGEQGDELTD